MLKYNTHWMVGLLLVNGIFANWLCFCPFEFLFEPGIAPFLIHRAEDGKLCMAASLLPVIARKTFAPYSKNKKILDSGL